MPEELGVERIIRIDIFRRRLLDVGWPGEGAWGGRAPGDDQGKDKIAVHTLPSFNCFKFTSDTHHEKQPPHPIYFWPKKHIREGKQQIASLTPRWARIMKRCIVFLL